MRIDPSPAVSPAWVGAAAASKAARTRIKNAAGPARMSQVADGFEAPAIRIVARRAVISSAETRPPVDLLQAPFS
jgi:hypothetical protein